jgi:hypothetical protein
MREKRETIIVHEDLIVTIVQNAYFVKLSVKTYPYIGKTVTCRKSELERSAII